MAQDNPEFISRSYFDSHRIEPWYPGDPAPVPYLPLPSPPQPPRVPTEDQIKDIMDLLKEKRDAKKNRKHKQRQPIAWRIYRYEEERDFFNFIGTYNGITSQNALKEISPSDGVYSVVPDDKLETGMSVFFVKDGRLYSDISGKEYK